MTLTLGIMKANLDIIEYDKWKIIFYCTMTKGENITLRELYTTVTKAKAISLPCSHTPYW